MFIQPLKITAIGTFMVALAIVLGAFAAHALRNKLGATDAQLEIFKTSVSYQMYNGLGLMIIGIMAKQFNLILNKEVSFIYLGTILFSGSLYALCLAAIYGTQVKFLGPITPIGGLLIIIGWLLITKKLVKYKSVT